MRQFVFFLIWFWPVLSGCGVRYSKVSGDKEYKDVHLVVTYPEGWYALKDSGKRRIYATSIGPSLQLVLIKAIDPKKSKTLHEGMDALELAQAFAGRDAAKPSYKLRDISPATVVGIEGFSTVVSYTRDTLPVTKKTYGFRLQSDVVLIYFLAPTEYYYRAFLDSFERLVKEMRILEK